MNNCRQELEPASQGERQEEKLNFENLNGSATFETKASKHLDQFDGSSLLPDSSPFSVIVEHAVSLLPDDVLGLLPHDVLHHALELDRGASVIKYSLLNL